MTKGKRNSLQSDRIIALAEVIAEQPHVMGPSTGGFNMSAYFHPCGAPSDIAGFAAAIASNGTLSPDCICGDSAFDIAKKYLGLDAYQAEMLIRPSEKVLGISWLSITPKRAAAVLEYLAKTGIVDWRKKPALALV